MRNQIILNWSIILLSAACLTGTGFGQGAGREDPYAAGTVQDTLVSPYADLFTLEQLADFEAYEDTINLLSDILFNDPNQQMRLNASHEIIRALKSALLTPNSFQYAFPNIQSISIVIPADEAFRIFTWQFTFNNNTYKYFGAIQMNSSETRLFPLVDQSAMMDDIGRMVTGNDQWIGALYYGICKVSDGTSDFYTLFGYDGNNAFSTKKIADVLWFTETGEPRFGAPIFHLTGQEALYRYVIEFKKGASAGINYSEEYGKIIFDNLIPVDDKSEGMYFNYVPDGSYNGFVWRNGKWTYEDELLDDIKLRDGEFPDESYPDKPSVPE